MRFKAGDKVRVKKFKERPSYWNWDGKMDHLMGKVVKIERTVNSRYVVRDSKNDYDWFFREDDLEPVNETIVIYSKDREVIAVDKITGDKKKNLRGQGWKNKHGSVWTCSYRRTL